MTMVAEQIVTVGLGEIKTSADGSTVLMALGLGSCIGVALFDPQARVGGLAHVVLPQPPDHNPTPSPKFATVAVPRLYADVLKLGAEKRRLVCKIAGGAQVLTTGTMPNTFRIGERNAEAVVAALSKLGLRAAASDCGGGTGRSLRLTTWDGRVTVKRLGSDWKDL
jgi:chemotaxis protein CheD